MGSINPLNCFALIVLAENVKSPDNAVFIMDEIVRFLMILGIVWYNRLFPLVLSELPDRIAAWCSREGKINTVPGINTRNSQRQVDQLFIRKVFFCLAVNSTGDIKFCYSLCPN